MNENKTEISSLGPTETLSAMENILDLLADAQGRAKCGYIFLLTELVDHMKTFEIGIKVEDSEHVIEDPKVE